MSGWEFWIDVGGTFTDCFARSDGGDLRHWKVLSSGVVRGNVDAGSSRETILASSRVGDPEEFWRGFELRPLRPDGNQTSSVRVKSFDTARGRIVLNVALPLEPQPGDVFELSSELAAPALAVRFLAAQAGLSPESKIHVRLGTTRGTNALITRRGARTAFVTTQGFGDILHIGYQNRPKLFDLAIRKPSPLFAAVLEVDERIDAHGKVLLAPEHDKVLAGLANLKSRGIESLAICLLNSYVNPGHEQLVARWADEAGFTEVSVSSEVSPLIKLVARGDTTVLDAYLNPVLRTYIAELRAHLPNAVLHVLTSAGGLVRAEEFVGKDSILSGPAGGAVGFSQVAKACGFTHAIGFDMGGTSTDVSRYEGQFELDYEREVSGVRIVAPMLAIETVAAGGGSICRFDGVKLVVGPESAGADPGPACYGRGGPLTVTDLNLLLGKIPEFPFPLTRSAALARLEECRQEILNCGGLKYEALALAEGFVRVANANMAKAIGSISVAKGCDPRQDVLVPFGGAGGQHACAVADELGIKQLLYHPHAGLLSAYGIGLADVQRHRAEPVYRPLDDATFATLPAIFERMERSLAADLLHEQILTGPPAFHRNLELRYRGVDAAIVVGLAKTDTREEMIAQFEQKHRTLYGYIHAGRELELVSVRLAATGSSADPLPESARLQTRDRAPSGRVPGYFGRMHDAALFRRPDLAPGDRFDGPAILCESASTTVIDPGWRAEVLSGGELLVERILPLANTWAASTEVDPVSLEIFNNQFTAIAERMGITLRNTSSSVNVKERLDFSCALFDAAGGLVVNAPHMPVHLGAMAETVRRTIADNPTIRPGDVFVTNDPYRGGSHLPDITVVTPIHHDGRIVFFTASRAHHAELGGITPGSMPPFSRSLAEEGVLIRNFKLLDCTTTDGGEPRWDAFRELLRAGPYPTRDVTANLADVAAAVAANRKGAVDLEQLIARHSLPVVSAYMQHIQQAAERKVRQALGRLPDGVYRFTDHMDDGTPIVVSVEISGESALIDFTGTGGVHAGNLNANRAIATAAVLYVLRTMLAEDIPLNQGVLAPVEIIIQPGILNPTERDRPEDCPAVVGGNVETSQRVVDVLLGALGLAAASQGTMNNLLFGDESFGYYETICGGSGATSTADGASAVHTHMTNTRLTDPEVLEQRYPVRVREFSIRRGSGGAGQHRGGDGVVRSLEFLKPLKVSILSQRRGPYPPYGLQGGEAGAIGSNVLRRADGRIEQLGALAQFTEEPGDVLTISTPGGGGFGPAGSGS